MRIHKDRWNQGRDSYLLNFLCITSSVCVSKSDRRIVCGNSSAMQNNDSPNNDDGEEQSSDDASVAVEKDHCHRCGG